MTQRFRILSYATGALIATATALALAFGSGVESASAVAASEVLVSADGVHFSTSLPRGILDGRGALVPGQSISSAVWVKNPTAALAELRVSMRDLTSSSVVYTSAVTMSAWNSATNITRTGNLGVMTRCGVLVAAHAVAAGGTVKVILTFALPDLDGVAAQGEQANFSIMVAMRGSEGGPFPASACDDDGVLVTSNHSRNSTIASTGSDLPTPLVILGGLLIGVGVFFVVGRRRKRTES